MLWAPYARAVGEAVGEAVMPRQDTGTRWAPVPPTPALPTSPLPRGRAFSGDVERAGQVALDRRRDRPDDGLARGRRERLDPDDVADHREADELRPDERRAELGVR